MLSAKTSSHEKIFLKIVLNNDYFYTLRILRFLVVTLVGSYSPIGYSFTGIDIPDIKPFQEKSVIVQKGNVVYFDGLISKQSFTTLSNFPHPDKIESISINSMGGDVEAALDIADWMWENHINITIRTVCASACANYLFPAARNKFIGKDSYLLLHGGVNSPEKEFQLDTNKDFSRNSFFESPEVKKIKSRELIFYHKINVDSKYPYCPQLEENYSDKFPEKWFSYEPLSLEKFGISNIHYANSPSQWILLMRSKNVIFANNCN